MITWNEIERVVNSTPSYLKEQYLQDFNKEFSKKKRIVKVCIKAKKELSLAEQMESFRNTNYNSKKRVKL